MIEEKMSAKMQTERRGLRASGVLGPNTGLYKSGSLPASGGGGAGGGAGASSALEGRVAKLETSLGKIFTIEEELKALKTHLKIA